MYVFCRRRLTSSFCAQTCAFFIDVTFLAEDGLYRLRQCMVQEKYKAGKVIFHQLTRDSSIYFLLSGTVELKITHPADGHIEEYSSNYKS